jgi:hypothetical protein
VQLDPNHYKKLKKGFQELVANGCAATKLGQYVDAGNAEAVSTLSIYVFAHALLTIRIVLWCEGCAWVLLV